MSDTQLHLHAAPHNNHQLFSDHYLDEVLPSLPAWRAALAAAAEARARIAEIAAAYAPSENEAQTEHGLVRPVLAALGHEFEVQPRLKTPDGHQRPDYVLYRSAEQRVAGIGRTLADSLPAEGAFGIAEAKYWDRPLDTALAVRGGDWFSNRNPGYQIAFYLQHSGLPWGILTNGRLWRLYHRDTAYKLDRYYEVDLPALLDSDRPEDFLYFYAFFRMLAFDDVPLGVAQSLRESVEYASQIGDLFTQFMERLPIPDLAGTAGRTLGDTAMPVTTLARTRYALHGQARHRIAADLGAPGRQLNQRLTVWWTLDFPGFRAELRKCFCRDTPVRERDGWEAWLAGQRAEHDRLTAEIVRLETELNALVYQMFDLTPAEIAMVGESTKYRYSEV